MSDGKIPKEVTADAQVDVEEVAKMLGIAAPLVLRRMEMGGSRFARKAPGASPRTKTGKS
ncbi:hypothetical protein JJB99_00575 [Bradyrhizobium diazoefficiens]|uniref:hypothetical protein n=1 Tax=Bradyrhizobium diazoefficiens TaxID=1355477 RepID=UPI00190A2412|nr:hypothetical protein [Bradyrhizobium diazoefficiens]QQO14733.1 hypothetical protein JJB99_00575 [Bradyrhizobium diazoefficiens]